MKEPTMSASSEVRSLLPKKSSRGRSYPSRVSLLVAFVHFLLCIALAGVLMASIADSGRLRSLHLPVIPVPQDRGIKSFRFVVCRFVDDRPPIVPHIID